MTILQSSGVIEYYEPEHTSKMGMDDASIREHEEVTKVKVGVDGNRKRRTSNPFRLVATLLIAGTLVRFRRRCIRRVTRTAFVFPCMYDIALHLRVLLELFPDIRRASSTHAKVYLFCWIRWGR